MTDLPILFSAPMVRALLAGTKTQTRRVIKPRPYNNHGDFVEISIAPSASYIEGHDGRMYFQFDHPRGGPLTALVSRINIGYRLWVKETWRPFSIDLAPWDIDVAYAADGGRRIIKDGEFGDNDWTMPKAAEHGNVSPLFMPRWASRITLTVTDVRVERLQAISEADAIAEGCFKGKASGRVFANEAAMHLGGDEWANARDWYADLWDSINGLGAWEANPWVAAYTFTVHRGNIDQIGGAA